MPEVPHSPEAERSVLGAVLLDERVLLNVKLAPPDFHREAHRLIFAAMLSLAARSAPIDAVTLGDELGASLADCGGQAYLLALENAVPTAANAAHYAALVADRAMRRRVLELAAKAGQAAVGDDVDTADLVALVQSGAMGLVREEAGSETSGASEIMGEAMVRLETLYDQGDKLSGLATGLADLDAMLGGLEPGQLVILAARPSVGKTALALQIAVHAAKVAPVMVFSLEMRKPQVANRMLANEGRVSLQRLRQGRLRDHEWPAVVAARAKLAAASLFVNDASTPSVFDLRVEARKAQAKARRPIGLIVVDYLQLMRARGDNREQAVAENSRGLKALAKEFLCPVLALSQLSRKVESRDDKRPHLSDLRESGALEQDADTVIFVHREDYYKRQEAGGKAELIVAKQRDGATGIVEVQWDAESTRFGNFTSDAAGYDVRAAAAGEDG